MIKEDKNNLRKRKQANSKLDSLINKQVKKSDDIKENKVQTDYNCMSIFTFIIGICLLYFISVKYSAYLKLLHENKLWFTNLKEVEREISFRTESGLYYSFYKELSQETRLINGFKSLIYNNDTECWRTINIIERFNIYQEIILATIYKLFNLQKVYFSDF